jgi:hypothetical protein
VYKRNIETKDYYNLNPYYVYGGCDYRIQKIINNTNPLGKKFVIIRDSFAVPITPFLALNAAELHLLDMREYISDESINAFEYINRVKPDYVVVIFSDILSIEDSGGKYNFNN